MDSPFNKLCEKLRRYLPEQTVPTIAQWIIDDRVKVKVTKSRSSKHGDYRPPANGEGHQITINQDLNPYEFLITLVHEFAHLRTTRKYYFQRFFPKHVDPHGKEWKQEFKQLMHDFLEQQIFPELVHEALIAYMADPAASSCSHLPLQRAIKQSDPNKSHILHLEELPDNSIFRLYDGRLFKKIGKRRKNYSCQDVLNGRMYIVSPIAEVTLENDPR